MPLALLRHATQKPPLGPLKLDLGHPLAQDLAQKWVLNDVGGGSLYVVSNTGNPTASFGTSTHAPTWASGPYGPHLHVVKSSVQYATGPLPVLPVQCLGVSIELLVNVPSTSEAGLYFNIGDTGGTNGIAIGVGVNDADTAGNNLLGLYNNVTWLWTNSGIGAAGWHSLALVVEPSGQPRMYIDGVLITNSGYTIGTKPNTATGGTILGAGTTTTRAVNSDIVDVNVYSRTLNPTEVAWLMDERYSMLVRPIQRWYILAAAGIAVPEMHMSPAMMGGDGAMAR